MSRINEGGSSDSLSVDQPVFPWVLEPIGSLAAGERQSPLEHLLDAVEFHIQEEGESVAEYEHLAATTHDPVITMLLRLVVEDEGRHHELMRRIATNLKDGLYWTHSSEALPDASIPHAADPHQGLDSLLLELMAMDSAKHERIMHYIAQRMQTAEKEAVR
jgi:hypothetical protein